MTYHEVDFQNWARKEHFLHFTKEVNCTACLTASVKIDELLVAINRRNLSFYITFLYCICRVINAHNEFKLSYREQDQKLIQWDTIVPSHLVFHKDTETFTRIWSQWDSNFETFYQNCEKDLIHGQSLTGYSVPNVPEHCFNVSCLPWIDYSALSLHIPEHSIYLAPIVTWGKVTKTNGITKLPLTMQIHHAAADGFHIARFFSELEQTTFALAQKLKF